ncbi:MAG: hypothetical protein EP341_00355 [Sphingomonadales bacterium]|nr:MAG: hypothetical protein EP341_00355 [Sphingomonadales bacterium]
MGYQRGRKPPPAEFLESVNRSAHALKNIRRGIVMRSLIVAAVFAATGANAGFKDPPICEMDYFLQSDIEAFENRLSVFLVASCPISNQGGIDKDCGGKLPNLTMDFLACNLAFEELPKRLACFDYVSRQAEWWKLDTR